MQRNGPPRAAAPTYNHKLPGPFVGAAPLGLSLIHISLRDIGIIDLELIMADVEMVERRIDKAQNCLLYTSPMTSDNEDAAAQPAVQSVRFYNETQEELVPLPPQQSYNVLQLDSILIQWTGGESLEWVKMFYTPIGGKTELAEEFKGPSDGGSVLLIPADALRREGQAHLYFELHFTGNYTVTTDEFQLYYDDGYTILTYIEDFDGKLLTFDMVEWVDPISDPARAEELGITDEDTPNGFYIYNEQDAAARRLVAEDCVYTVRDQYHNYVPVTVSASEFQALLNELSSGIPYALTIAEDQIVEIREQYIP